MAKVLSRHVFTNGREITVGLYDEAVSEPDKEPDGDLFALVFDDGKDRICMLMRPDEVVITIKVLAEAICTAVDGYTVGD